MSKSKDDPRRPTTGQDALIDAATVDRPVRRVEQAVAESVEAAKLDPRDKAMGALAIECGTAVDVGSRRLDPYAVATAARELRETLVRLRLDPVSRAEGGTDLDDLLSQLGPSTPDVKADDQA